MSKNSLALIYTAVIAISFFLAGAFDVLDYFIVKALLFVGFIILIVVLILQFMKDIENKNHLE